MTVALRNQETLAPFAMHEEASAGRKCAEPEHPYRGIYQRDRDRIVHSSAFRRLAYKTQVFTGEMGDYHRTRLTHTLEVTSIARTLARALRLNEDLVEALALAHDIGHPPFGHAGEAVLDECLRDKGGFSHNAQALRIMELLETPYSGFPGLNLSHELLDGQAHRTTKSHRAGPSPLLEVQLVDAADSIAYNAHDADDALQLELLKRDDLDDVPLWQTVAEKARRDFGDLDDTQFRRAAVRGLIDCQVSDLLSATRERLECLGIVTPDDVRAAEIVVQCSEELEEQKQTLQKFLFDRVYRHPEVLLLREVAQREVREMFTCFAEHPERLPPPLCGRQQPGDPHRAVADHLASMTDHFAREEHERLFRKA